MKQLTLFILFFSTFTFAQNSVIFQIDSLPTEGVLLNQGWKFHVGDNPEWAKFDFDDSGWEGIDPTLTIPEIYGIEKNTSIWLRINIETTKSIVFAAAIKQSVASEIYLNGKFLKSFGKIDSLGEKTKAYMPVNNYLLLKLDSSKNTIAIRVFFQKGLRYKRFTSLTYPLFFIQLFDENNISKQLYAKDYIWEGFNIGFPFILFLVYFTIFIFYTPNKSALMFSLWGLFNSCSSFLNTLAKITPDIGIQNEYICYSAIVSAFTNISLVYSIYLLLNQKRSTFLSLFIILTALSTIYYFIGSGETQYIVDFLVTLFYVVIIVLMGKNALRQGNVGGKYVIFGAVFFIILWAMFLFDLVTDDKSSIVADILFHSAVLSLPVMVAVLLGLDFKNKNKSLLKNIEEVRKLASEKQQILATQNETLEKQVEQRTAELKASQAQLIQKEKLASLGELTAGIAHEIQNPLNFVNNFSELSVGIAQDLKEEMEKPNQDKQYIGELLTDLTSNQEKINHHGKRASNIVKGMLEHSRASTGERQLTNINALCDEYLRLSYHGMRAKDKSFNADFKTEFDENLPQINVIPQDIGRVLLNLMNNAFYAVHQRKQQLDVSSDLTSSLDNYTPSVFVSTKQLDDQIIISIKDNGNGIPNNIKSKIFQPFFTTKPTGEGTGLGLSLAYDIVTKGHSGRLEVESTVTPERDGAQSDKEVGSEFTIQLPIA